MPLSTLVLNQLGMGILVVLNFVLDFIALDYLNFYRVFHPLSISSLGFEVGLVFVRLC